MIDESDKDSENWIRYETYIEERVDHLLNMLEQFEIGGPFEFPKPPVFLVPKPPIPGTVEECETFSSHFESCDISKVNYYDLDELTTCIKLALFLNLINANNLISLFIIQYVLFIETKHVYSVHYIKSPFLRSSDKHLSDQEMIH